MTIYVSDAADPNHPVAGGSSAGTVKVAHGEITLTDALLTGDTLELCRVPKGAVVVGGVFRGGIADIGTSAALNVDIGWKANGDEIVDADGFGDLGILSYAAVTGVRPETTGFLYPFGGVLKDGPKTLNAETVIQATVVASAATQATSGTVTVGAVVYYKVP